MRAMFFAAFTLKTMNSATSERTVLRVEARKNPHPAGRRGGGC